MRAINTIALVCIAITGLAACDRTPAPVATNTAQPPAAASAPVSASAASAPVWQDVAPVAPLPPSPPPPPPHNYVMEQDGTYGYEPALSEDDVRSGRAVKPLVMMRYVGVRDGSYVILILDQDNKNVATRMTCQAPCNFATTQFIAGTTVLKTETIRVTHSSLAGGMFEDAMSGVLKPYGQAVAMSNPIVVPAPVDSQANAQVAQQTQSGSPDTPQTTASVQQPSFDCAKAKSIPEYLICHDFELAASDRELAGLYIQAKAAATDKTAFADRTRKQWNYREKNCRDKDCLKSWYAYQKNVLTKIAQTGDAQAN